MATSKRCSMCNKESGPMHCTGCDKYFCWKDLKTHREEMFTEMDKIVEERNRLHDVINNPPQSNDQENPIIEQINQWENNMIEKAKQVAEKARQQAIELLTTKRVKINIEFKNFSQELAHLKESENYFEHDLTRLNEMINQLKRDLEQSTQLPPIDLHVEERHLITWDTRIFMEKNQTLINNQQQQAPKLEAAAPPSQRKLECGGRACPKCGHCGDWYINNGMWTRHNDVTCTSLGYYLHSLYVSVCNCN